MKTTDFLLSTLALGGAALLLAPSDDAAAFSTLGGSLSAEGQRDMRVFNNFLDPQANDNISVDPNWPGWIGAEVAFWKALAEWGSESFGDGSGDPLQTAVGDGGANFDAFWAGNASAAGGVDDNVVEALQSGGSCGGGVIAYVQTPISDGWTMKYCDGSFVFWDGPGDNSGTSSMDIQGIAAHEYGHALGLGHSTVNDATMFASTSSDGSSEFRSIEADDAAGVQFVYGVKSVGKPRIDAVSVAGGQVTLTGANFSTTGGEVWFTNADATLPAADPRVRITNVASTAGGTQIVLSLPTGAASGNVAVKQSATGHATLSNMYPLDTGAGLKDPFPRFVASATAGEPPLTVAFLDQSFGTGLVSWMWNFGDGSTSSLQSPTHSYNLPGSYDVSLTVVGTNGSNAESKPGYIVVEDPFAQFVAMPTSGCLPLLVSFTDLSLGTALNSWQWDFGDGQTSSTQSPQHTYTLPGTYDVTLTVSGAAGSDDERKFDLIVVMDPTPASCTGNNGAGTNPNIYTCTAPPVIGGTWQGLINGGGVGATGLSFVFGYEDSLPGLPTVFGELLIDPTSGFVLLNTSFFLGGIANHSEPIPNQIDLIAFGFATQAFLNGNGILTNRQDLVLGL